MNARLPECRKSAWLARLLLCPMVALLVAVPRPAGAQPGVRDIVPPSPAPDGFVVDRAGVLDAAAMARLNDRITAVQAATGGDVGVVILTDLRGRDASDVGVAVYRAWGIGTMDSIGSARRDLGALLLIVPKELSPTGQGDCWITTGSGAEATLHDGDAGYICREMVVPELRERQYERAVAAGVSGIGSFLARAAEGESGASRSILDDGGAGRRGPLAAVLPWIGIALVFTPLLFPLGVVAIVVGYLLRKRQLRRRPRPCPRGHGPMVCLDEDADDVALDAGQRKEERVGSVDYDVWACRSCDERIVIPYRRWSRYDMCPQCRYRTLRKAVRTVMTATIVSGGREEITLACVNCGWRNVSFRATPRLNSTSGSSGGSGRSRGSSGSSGSRSSSFGGSGRTGGGGGGSRY